MPFKSDAQRKFMFAAEKRGDIPKGTAEEFADATPKGKKLPEHVKKNKSVDALKAMNQKFDDEFLKGSLVEKVESKDPEGPYRSQQESMLKLAKAESEDEENVDKGLTARVVNSIARGYRNQMAYAEEVNPDAFKAGIARNPDNMVGFFRMTPAGEPPAVPVRHIEAPLAPTTGSVYKSCTGCGRMNKSIAGEETCTRCESLRASNNTAKDFWRR